MCAEKVSIMKDIKKLLFFLFFAIFLFPSFGSGVTISDYTAFPPFLPRVVDPNILFVLDTSSHMVRPAYGHFAQPYSNTTDFYVLENNYDSSRTYEGIYGNNNYACTNGGSCVRTGTADSWNGNWLNWLAMSQFDIVKQVAVGGNISPAPESAGPGTLQSRTTTMAGHSFYKLVPQVQCQANAPNDLCNEIFNDPSRNWQFWPYNWIVEPTSGTYNVTTLWTSGDSNGGGAVLEASLPFEFKMFGQQFSVGQKVWVNVNGTIRVRDTEPSSIYNNVSLPSDNDYMLAPYWVNQGLYSAVGSEIKTYTIGEVGNRIFVINFKNVIDETKTTNPSASDVNLYGYTYQVVLYENSNVVVYNYQQVQEDEAFQFSNPSLKTIATDVNGNPISSGFGAGQNATIGVQGNGSAVLHGHKLYQIKSGTSLIFTPGEDNLLFRMATTGTSNQSTKISRVYYQYINNSTVPDPETTANSGWPNDYNMFKNSTMATPAFKALDATIGGSAVTAPTYDAHVEVNEKATYTSAQDCFDAGYDWNPINTKCYDHQVNGLLQYFRENDLAGTLGFRLGFMLLNSDGDGGVMEKHIGQFESATTYNSLTGLYESAGGKDAQWSNLMNATRGATAVTHAPLAEALFEMQGYLRQDATFNIGGGVNMNDGVTGACTENTNTYDPYCYKSAAQKVPCAKSFVLMITGGHYSDDNGTNIFTAPALTFGSDGMADTESQWNNSFGSWAKGAKTITSVYNSTTFDSTVFTPEASKENGGWLDNVAYMGRATDLRPEAAVSDEEDKLVEDQVMTLYVVDTYAEELGDGTSVLKKAAAYGGYEDVDDLSNTAYMADPRTYFSAGDGDGIKGAILNAVFEILKNSSSGTSVSVLSTSAGGEGALYQAYFYPAKVLQSETTLESQERQWPGYMRAFYIDRYQNMRDDFSSTTTTASSPLTNSDPNARLQLELDRIVQMSLSADNAVVINLYKDTDGDGSLSATELAAGPENSPPIGMDDVGSLWEGGESLAKQTRSTRNIYLWVDKGTPGSADEGKEYDDGEGDFSSPSSTFAAGETFKLSTGLAADLVPYLRADETVDPDTSATLTDATQEATNLINFIIGHEIYNSATNNQLFRTRCMWVPKGKKNINLNGAAATSTDLTANGPGCAMTLAEQQLVPSNKLSYNWPLGDIVFSTPTLVSGPSENYDKIYGSTSYRDFRKKYRQRRNVVFVGANDGMLHAFNGGVFNEGNPPSATDVEAYFESGPADEATNSHGDIKGHALGEELWAFLPYDLLPHMPWLTCNGSDSDASACQDSEYTHVYYVDNRAKVTDVQMFNNNDTVDPSLNYTGSINGQSGDGIHPNGWGTVLLLSMRLGGGAMDIADFNGTGTTRSFRSAYYALDITDPERPPKLLWRWTHDDLGFSTSYPAIVRTIAGNGDIVWHMMVGSGPMNQIPEVGMRDYGFIKSTSTGAVFAVNMATGVGTKLTDTNNVFTANQIMGDPTVIDVNGDFKSDVIYIGSTSTLTTAPRGKMYRIQTANSSIPANWVVSEFFSATDLGPTLVGASATKNDAGKLWIYFGSGRLRSRADIDNYDQQRFYGIKEECWDGETRVLPNPDPNTPCTTTYTIAGDGGTNAGAGLVKTSGVKVFELSATQGSATQFDAPANSVCGASAGTCDFTAAVSAISAKQGWYIDLDVPTGTDAGDPSERILSKSSVLGGLVLFTAYQPATNVCSIFGTSQLYSLYYETGTAYRKATIGVDATTGEILSKQDIGQGMPTSVGVAIGETVSGFIQKSTGEIITVESEPAIKVKSGPSSWRVEPTGGGTTGIETIYKHIAK